MALLGGLCQRTPALFPMHPRTRERLHATAGVNGSLWDDLATEGMSIVEPLGYAEFSAPLPAHARC